MFQVNRTENRLLKLEEKRFSDLALREREHLQEWLANQPDALGEDLLIIQKEFDGFADTRERLDLLALDKDGQLVVIENKLDDSGRDVAWQALKYAAYVSSLKTTQVVDIFQQYLARHAGGGNAAELISEFLGLDTLDGETLNEGSSQRIVLIAAHFRKEVTSTVLWLREHQIDVRCYRVIPYAFGDELFIDIQPVIPTPEAADFMIRMAEKESEAKTAHTVKKRRHTLRHEFWTVALDHLRQHGVSRFDTVGPTQENWITCGTGLGAALYGLAFTQSEARVELVINSSSQEKNKQLFDDLTVHRAQIDATFGAPLDWQRLDDKKMCRVVIRHPFDGFEREAWTEMAEWMAVSMKKFQQVFDQPISTLRVGRRLEGQS